MKTCPRDAAFLLSQDMKHKASEELAASLVSVRRVENITGLDFFSALPDDTESAVESGASVSQWNNLTN